MRAYPVLLMLVVLSAAPSRAQEKPVDSEKRLQAAEDQIRALEEQLTKLDKREQSWTNHGKQEVERVMAEIYKTQISFTLCFLFTAGVFCARWAQDTRRNARLWFLCGFLFHVLAVAVLLYKNSIEAGSKQTSA